MRKYDIEGMVDSDDDGAFLHRRAAGTWS